MYSPKKDQYDSKLNFDGTVPVLLQAIMTTWPERRNAYKCHVTVDFQFQFV